MKKKAIIEKTARIIFLVCAVIAIFAVCSITVYMFIKGAPALKKVGVSDSVINGSLRQRIHPMEYYT